MPDIRKKLKAFRDAGVFVRIETIKKKEGERTEYNKFIVIHAWDTICILGETETESPRSKVVDTKVLHIDDIKCVRKVPRRRKKRK